MPGHDGRQNPAIRAHAGLQRGDDLLHRPVAESGFLVGGQIGADEGAEAGEEKSDIRAGEIALLFFLAEEMAGRVAIGAAIEGNQIFAARHLLVAGAGGLRRGAECRRHEAYRQDRMQYGFHRLPPSSFRLGCFIPQRGMG